MSFYGPRYVLTVHENSSNICLLVRKLFGEKYGEERGFLICYFLGTTYTDRVAGIDKG